MSKRLRMSEFMRQPRSVQEISKHVGSSKENTLSEIYKMRHAGHKIEVINGYPKKFKYISGPEIQNRDTPDYQKVLIILKSDNPTVGWLNTEICEMIDRTKHQVFCCIRYLRESKGFNISCKIISLGVAEYKLER